MQPFSKRSRRLFLIALILVFCIVAPAAALYASGYRISDLSFAETGGIYISAPVSGADVSINGKEEKTTSFISRSVYVPDLKPGRYAVDVTLDDYYPWHKTLVVEAGLVTDIRALLVPNDLTFIPIRVSSPASVATSSIDYVSKSEYALIRAAFATTTNPAVPDGLNASDVRNSESLYVDGGNVVVLWERNAASTPSEFCATPSSCATEIVVKKAGSDPATYARFFQGGVVYSTEHSGIFIADADVREPQVVLPLYQKTGAEFRLVNNALIVEDPTGYYQVQGF